MHEPVEEVDHQVGPHDEGEDQAIDGSPQMGAVRDVVAGTLIHINAIHYIEHTEKDVRDAEGSVEADAPGPGVERDGGEYQGRYRARGSECRIIPVVAVTEKIGQGGGGQGRYIKQNELQGCEHHGFQYPAEEEKGKHVEAQMDVVGMDKPVREEAVILFGSSHDDGIEQQRSLDAGVAEGQQGNAHGDGDDEVGEGGFHICSRKLVSSGDISPCS